ncbi:alpha/beta fold hydrolase [Nocardiopsis sp. CT-R113]|uniref:Alpha/beta fold hydrolase n=1 Tax=Nocardiopsis codii TaxID=3065942 RepID=A0ABU7KCS3_9ACTN|nr:alpha/beta fold hydrolase [Nocardiopsis sp. CT-R113]MEE2040040.1 alpha/beta fold hydrolase [Nocardiopsis sp. CT-R113]
MGEADWRLGRRFEAHNGTVHWDRFGEGDPVVLMHGTPFSSYVWRHVARALSGRYTVHVWDMPGYGASAKYEGQDVSLPAQQAAFTALLAHWGLERPAVVAHDFGGAVALRAAVLDGVAYERLALVDAVSVRPWGSDFFRLVNANADVFAALPPYLHEALVRTYIASAAHRELRTETLDALVRPWLGEDGRPAFYRQIAQADERYTAEVEDGYARLDQPTLVVWGREDTWLPLERGERLAAAIPGAGLHPVDGAGHLVQEDAPAELVAALLSFLH